jgi:hypothetical protein
VSQSIDLDLPGLRQVGERLENATKDWELAYRLYVLKSTMTFSRVETAAVVACWSRATDCP